MEISLFVYCLSDLFANVEHVKADFALAIRTFFKIVGMANASEDYFRVNTACHVCHQGRHQISAFTSEVSSFSLLVLLAVSFQTNISQRS